MTETTSLCVQISSKLFTNYKQLRPANVAEPKSCARKKILREISNETFVTRIFFVRKAALEMRSLSSAGTISTI